MGALEICPNRGTAKNAVDDARKSRHQGKKRGHLGILPNAVGYFQPCMQNETQNQHNGVEQRYKKEEVNFFTEFNVSVISEPLAPIFKTHRAINRVKDNTVIRFYIGCPSWVDAQAPEVLKYGWKE